MAALPLLLAGLALGYMAIMSGLEGTDRDFYHALEWAAETVTTTGYGNDDQWHHPLTVAYVIFAQFVGVFLVFLIVPIYLIPFLEERFEGRVPRTAPKLCGHVLIYRYGPAVETLIEQLDAAGVPYIVVEIDQDAARAAFELGVSVVYSPTEDGALEAGRIESARAVVANGRDEENVAVIVGVRQLGFEGDVIALVEAPMHRRPMTMAGATMAVTPRHALAAALAARASDKISPRVSGLGQLGPLAVREIRIEEGSALVGRTLRDAEIGARAGVTVIGQWINGELGIPDADRPLRARTILVVVGSEDAVEQIGELFEGSTTLRRRGPFVIAGFGEVGKKVQQLLTDVGEETWVVDVKEMPGVDVVGSVLDPEVLCQCRLAQARGVIVALDRDDLTLFTAVLAKEHAPTAPVTARVNQAHNADKIRRAGADFALSISHVSGQMLSRRLLGEESLSIDVQLKLMKVTAKGLVGRHPTELAIRERTGCSVVAIARGGEVIVDLGPTLTFEADDAVYLGGPEEGIRRFLRELGGR